MERRRIIKNTRKQPPNLETFQRFIQQHQRDRFYNPETRQQCKNHRTRHPILCEKRYISVPITNIWHDCCCCCVHALHTRNNVTTWYCVVLCEIRHVYNCYRTVLGFLSEDTQRQINVKREFAAFQSWYGKAIQRSYW